MPKCRLCDYYFSSEDWRVELLTHLFEEHPRSDRFQEVLEAMWVDVECENCGDSIKSKIHIGYSTGARHADVSGEPAVEKYCSNCKRDDDLRSLTLEVVSVEKIAESTDPDENETTGTGSYPEEGSQ